MRIASILFLVSIGLALTALARPSPAQPGCWSRYGYWSGGIVCTDQAGVNCVYCPP